MRSIIVMFTILFFGMILFFTGCMTSKIDNGMQKLELGMSKKEVLSIMGNDYETVGARMTYNGPVESIRYYSLTLTGECFYLLSFKDNKLIEWLKEEPRPKPRHQKK